MSTQRRCYVLSTLMLLGLLTHLLWKQHLVAGSWQPQLPLTRSLNAVPFQIGEWVGRDEDVAQGNMFYGDGHLHRVYVNQATGQSVSLWMVYTNDGRDRGHHPDVCMRVAGFDERGDRRQELPLSRAGATARRMHFVRPGVTRPHLVYYWHYTLTGGSPDARTWAQHQWRTGHDRSSSLTVELFATRMSDRDQRGADHFAQLVDSTLQLHLPMTAVCGNDFEPFVMFRQGGLQVPSTQSTR